eukprot:7378751-Prymnesium_polylepis.2
MCIAAMYRTKSRPQMRRGSERAAGTTSGCAAATFVPPERKARQSMCERAKRTTALFGQSMNIGGRGGYCPPLIRHSL